MTLHEVQGTPRPAFVLFRHGLPHRHLPNQIPYRANALALRAVGCRALVVTSSVGVLDRGVPLSTPLLAGDLLTLDNRLPCGAAMTLFDTPQPGQGHLVLQGGLFSAALNRQLRALGASGPEVVFGYVGGPRTKTRAENRMWAALGAQVNSMTVGPEVVLASELGIPCAALLVGHKHSLPDPGSAPSGPDSVAASLDDARAAMSALVRRALHELQPVPSDNHLYRFDDDDG